MSNIKINFGVKCFNDLIDVVEDGNSLILNKIILNHKDFVIKTTIQESDDESFGLINSNDEELKKYNGKNYRKYFRKTILWDFGDGTKIEGTSAEHVYTRAGKYKITSTFFDIDRRASINSYSFFIIVKETIPTKLEFDERENQSINQLCTKYVTNRIKNENSLSLNCSEITKICKINSYIGLDFTGDFSISAKRTDSEKENEDDYDSILLKDYSHLNKYYTFLQKKKNYINNYKNIYNETYEPTYTFVPSYKKVYTKFNKSNADEIKPSVILLDENYDGETPVLKILDTNTVYTPNEKSFIYNEIFYETVNDESLIPSDYEYSGKIASTDIYYKDDYVKESKKQFSFSYELNATQYVENCSKTKSNYINIPPLGMNLYIVRNNYNKISYCYGINCFLTSDNILNLKNKVYIQKLLEKSFVENYSLPFYIYPFINGNISNELYIPKDFSFNFVQAISLNQENDCSLYINKNLNFEYVFQFMLELKTNLNISMFFSTFDCNLSYKDLHKNLLYPKVKTEQIDVDKSIKVYTPHVMFDEASNLKEFLVQTLSESIQISSEKIKNFLNDTIYYRTTSIDNFISILKSFNIDTNEYEISNLSSVEDLSELLKIMSINHSVLIGNKTTKEEDYNVYNESEKGANVGFVIYPSDSIIFEDGKISKIIKNGKEIPISNENRSEKIIVKDDYTNETKLCSLYSFSTLGKLSLNDITDEKVLGMSLPEEFQEAMTKERREVIINRYYTFYTFIPNTSKTFLNNYIDESTIGEDLFETEKWDETDGYTFDLLFNKMKNKLFYNDSITSNWEQIL